MTKRWAKAASATVVLAVICLVVGLQVRGNASPDTGEPPVPAATRDGPLAASAPSAQIAGRSLSSAPLPQLIALSTPALEEGLRTAPSVAAYTAWAEKLPEQGGRFYAWSACKNLLTPTCKKR